MAVSVDGWHDCFPVSSQWLVAFWLIFRRSRYRPHFWRIQKTGISVANPLEKAFRHIAGIHRWFKGTLSALIRSGDPFDRAEMSRQREMWRCNQRCSHYLPAHLPENPIYRKIDSGTGTWAVLI